MNYPIRHSMCRDNLKATPLQLISHGKDNSYWRLTPSGNYSVKTAYQLLKEDHSQQSQDWTWLWKMNVLPKLKFFLWQCLHQILPTRDLLNNRGLILPLHCPLCNHNREDLQHILKDCPKVQEIWIHLGFSPSTSPDIKHWLQNILLDKNYHQLHKIPLNLLATHVLWEIWC